MVCSEPGIRGSTGPNAEAHKAVVKAAGSEAHTARLKEEQVNLDGLKESGGRKVAKRLERMGETGTWLSVIPNRIDLSSPIALTERSCQGRTFKTTLPFAMVCAQGAFLNAAMDATNPSQLSTGSVVRRAALWDSGMRMYAKNWHTCA